MPPILFCRGTVLPDDRGVSVVGSRSADAKALEFARRVVQGLVGVGLSVLSGLARGIDTAAHLAALRVSGRYGRVPRDGDPGLLRNRRTRDLQDRVEYARASSFRSSGPRRPPQKHTFPMRNAVHVGLRPRDEVVVAAGETSGMRTQARFAVEHGRPVILHEAVARETAWGRALTGRPGVFVASDLDEVLAIVDDVARPLAETLDDLLTPLG